MQFFWELICQSLYICATINSDFLPLVLALIYTKEERKNEQLKKKQKNTQNKYIMIQIMMIIQILGKKKSRWRLIKLMNPFA